ncbi:MAG: adenylate kinase [Candidatus Izemoplasma sp.]
MKILVMGPPGAGKGSQAAKIVEHFKIPNISTGDMFREAYRKGEAIGIEAMNFIKYGNLVSDDITNELVRKRLLRDDAETRFLLDGYPRTVAQAVALDEMLAETSSKLDSVLNIIASREILFERMEGRRVCRTCGTTYHLVYKPSEVEHVCDKCSGELYQRQDDSHESVKRRLEIYETKTKPLLDYYEKKGILHHINGVQSFDDVFTDIELILRDL